MVVAIIFRGCRLFCAEKVDAVLLGGFFSAVFDSCRRLLIIAREVEVALS
jgi:hypothetical protein